MFSTKKNILQTVALLKAYNVKQVVMSPGSRNAPIMHTISQDPFFQCHTIVDERNAAFYAIGIIQCLQQPVAVCCTSGSALLNYAPAVSEAYYAQLPLIVISADRSPEWIGQMDGQTILQTNVFGSLVRKTVNLPEINNPQDEWFCNRLVNEALIACTARSSAPVHINIPLSEPLFDYSENNLPHARQIQYTQPIKTVDTTPFAKQWDVLPKRMIIIGQMLPHWALTPILERLTAKTDCVVFCEHLANTASDLFIHNFDALLYALSDENKENYSPDLVITIGGHITSKRLKHFIRQHKPVNHWHISQSENVTDLFQSLTNLIEADEKPFFESLSDKVSSQSSKPFYDLWQKTSASIAEPQQSTAFSDISVTRDFLKALPNNSALHLANSSPVRNAQLYTIDKTTSVYANRGVNGIEGTLPTVVGYASVSDKPVYLLIGDLSFFYGLNSLWNTEHLKNLRILLINNGGGGIFHLLPGLDSTTSLNQHVAAMHNTKAEKWAQAAGLRYLSAANQEELNKSLKTFMEANLHQSVLLEVSTDMEVSKKAFKEYYHQIKNNQ